MSLFADKWPAPFDSANPFGLDSFHSSSLGGFRWGSGSSLFGDKSEEESVPSPRMKFRSGPSLVERGFYDHFDSLFHDLTSSGSRRQYDLREGESASRRSQSQRNGNRGKEFVIPIKIETSSAASRGENNSHSPLNRYEKEGSRCRPSISSSSTAASARQSDTGRVIQIPVVREGSSQKNPREKSRSPVVSDSFKVPPKFTILTPTTEENGSTQKRDTANDVYLDSDAFFAKSRNTPRQSQSRKDAGIKAIEIREEEEETTIKSLRRKPLRHHLQNDAALSTQSTLTSQNKTRAVDASSSRRLASSRNDAHKNDAAICREEATQKEREEKERERKQPLCSNPELTDVTPTPSYPIYDHLKPR